MDEITSIYPVILSFLKLGETKGSDTGATEMEKLSIWPQGSYRSPPRKNGVGDIAIVDE